MNFIKEINEIEKKFMEDGYFIMNLNNKEYLNQVSASLEKHLQHLTKNEEINLKNYHLYFESDQEHYDLQFQMLEFFRKNQFAQNIITNNSDLYQFLMGPDLEIQAEPYLRITRPNKPKDNIGYHRDTFYGSSPSEISTLIPFVDLTEKNCLSVFPKSHTIPDKDFTINQITNEDAPKNSNKHKMGFLYAPKLMGEEIKKKMVPIPLKKGQALVFMLSTVHGSEQNQEKYTRWSTDIRIRNALIPLNTDMKANYYQVLKKSALTQTFEKFYQLVQKD